MLIRLITYQPIEYSKYLNSIKKPFSSTGLMEDFMLISKKLKTMISPEVEFKLRHVDEQYYLYLYYENNSITELYNNYSYLIEQLKNSFPRLDENSGFIDTKRKNLVLVLGYYEKSA